MSGVPITALLRELVTSNFYVPDELLLDDTSSFLDPSLEHLSCDWSFPAVDTGHDARDITRRSVPA